MLVVDIKTFKSNIDKYTKLAKNEEILIKDGEKIIFTTIPYSIINKEK